MDNKISTLADVQGPPLTDVNSSTITGSIDFTTLPQSSRRTQLTPVSQAGSRSGSAPASGAAAAEEHEIDMPPRAEARSRRRRRTPRSSRETESESGSGSSHSVARALGELTSSARDDGVGGQNTAQSAPARLRGRVQKRRGMKPRGGKPASPADSSLDPLVDVGVDLGEHFKEFTVMASSLSDVELLSLPGYGDAILQLALLRGRWFTPRALRRRLFGRELCVRLRFGAASVTEYVDESDERLYVFRATGRPVAAHIARVSITWEIVETPGCDMCYDIPLVAKAYGPIVWSSPVGESSILVSINGVATALTRLTNMPAIAVARSQIEFLRRAVEGNVPWYLGQVSLFTPTYALARHASSFDGGSFYTYRGPLEQDRLSRSSNSSISTQAG